MAQEVRLTVELTFQETPPACQTDRMVGTVCYSELSEKIRAVVAHQEFHTIEKIAQKAWEAIAPLIPSRTETSLRVHKVKPPVPGLLGGTIFEIRF